MIVAFVSPYLDEHLNPHEQVRRVRRTDQRRQEDEEDHVGSVLERPPEILQISLHRFEGEKVLSSYKAGS